MIQDHGKGEFHFYDLVKDPGEASPVPAESDPRGKAALEEARIQEHNLQRVRSALRESGADSRFEPDPRLQEALRSLGYTR